MPHCCRHATSQVLLRLTLHCCAAVLACRIATGQPMDPGQELNARLATATGQRLKLTVEFRSRFETRTGVNFGRSVDLENPLFRTRIGIQFKPVEWLKLSAMGQDSRAPLYGRPAPNSARDTMDLHEAYLELFPDLKLGFGAIVGRQMVVKGEGRLIGVPDWLNTARTYDTARLYYRLPRGRLEFLFLSTVKVQPDAFNTPVLGDRLWGTYNTFPELVAKGTVEVYLLRRDQNRPGGFASPGRLSINTLGGRFVGPLPGGLRYSLETALQGGKAGLLDHRAFAWFSNVSKRVDLGVPVDVSAEYKYASGSGSPTRSSTFNQLYAANHDKFGHADLFGWRNIHDLRSLETANITKTTALNFMYNNFWLASPTDALYSGAGLAIAQSVTGNAGRHVGQEFDVFATQKWGGFIFGAGFAHLFKGEFLRNTTPGVNTRYLYIFQSYSF